MLYIALVDEWARYARHMVRDLAAVEIGSLILSCFQPRNAFLLFFFFFLLLFLLSEFEGCTRISVFASLSFCLFFCLFVVVVLSQRERERERERESGVGVRMGVVVENDLKPGHEGLTVL